MSVSGAVRLPAVPPATYCSVNPIAAGALPLPALLGANAIFAV